MAVPRSLLCLVLGLLRASAYSTLAGAPVPHGRAQCFRRQPEVAVSRHSMAPQMSSDGLSEEFQRMVSARSGTVFGQPAEVLRKQRVETPWVLIFNAGTHEEGMYTLQGRKTSPECSGTFALAFERREEASRFAMLLQAQGFGMPTAVAWDAAEFIDFCSSADFGVGFVRTDALLFPPQNNYFDADLGEQHADPRAGPHAPGQADFPTTPKPGTGEWKAAPGIDEWTTTLASERGGKPLSPSYVDGQGGKTRNTRPSQKGDERYRSSRPLGTTPRGGKPLDTPGWGAPLGPPPHPGVGAGPSPYDNYEQPRRPRSASPSSRPSASASRPPSSRSSRGKGDAPDERHGTRTGSSFGEGRPPRSARYPRPSSKQGSDFLKSPPRRGEQPSKRAPRGRDDDRDGPPLSSRPPRDDSRDSASRAVPRTVYGEAKEVLREAGAEGAWVLIFNKGREDEGMYTLQGRETPAKGSGTFVMAFERREAASRFAMLLQAQGFGMPTSTSWDTEELSDFCDEADFGVGFVPEGALVFPPEENYFDADAFAAHKLKEEAEETWGVEGAEVRRGLDRLFEL